MRPSNPRQYSRVYAALATLKLGEEEKKDMVYDYTKDKTKLSLKDLTYDQCHELITNLNNMISPSSQQPAKAVGKNDPDKESKERIRRKIIAIAHNLGWYQKDDKQQLILSEAGKKQLDYKHLDNWLLTRTAAKKALNDMDKSELQKAAYQIDAMYTATITKTK